MYNDPEFVSREVDLWAYENNVVLDFSRPGKPIDNASIESFNSRFRQECLNQHWFLSLEDARSKIEFWRLDYNRVRPHSSPSNQTPEAFLQAFSSGQNDPYPKGDRVFLALDLDQILGTGQRGLIFSQGMVHILGNSQDERLTYRTLHHLR